MELRPDTMNPPPQCRQISRVLASRPNFQDKRSEGTDIEVHGGTPEQKKKGRRPNQVPSQICGFRPPPFNPKSDHPNKLGTWVEKPSHYDVLTPTDRSKIVVAEPIVKRTARRFATIELVLPKLLRLEWCEAGLSGRAWDQVPVEESVKFLAVEPIAYVDPSALAMLGAWAHQRKEAGGSIEIDESVRGLYAWRSGLLPALAGRFDTQVEASEHRFAVRVKHEWDIETALSPLRTVLHLDPETTNAVIYCLSELLRNVFEHASSAPGAFLCASHFPKSGRVSLAVVDLGVTIPWHVARRWDKSVPQEQALQFALEPRVTGSTDLDRNAGLGLFMVRRLSGLMGGLFWVATGDLLARDNGHSPPGARSTPVITPITHRWPGTSVALTVYPDRIQSFEKELRAADDEVLGGKAGRKASFFRKNPREGLTEIRVPPDVSTIAQDKVAAVRIRDERIMPALRAGQGVSLDFGGVVLTTQSFMHALISAPVRLLGPDDIETRLSIVGASSQVKEVVRLVVGYVLDNPDG